MSNPLRTPDDYELFVYTLVEQFPSVRRSTMTFVRLGATLARVSGELRFDHDIRLVIRERVLSHLARRADVEVTPHTLRHTFAKNLVNSGVSLEKKSPRSWDTATSTPPASTPSPARWISSTPSPRLTSNKRRPFGHDASLFGSGSIVWEVKKETVAGRPACHCAFYSIAPNQGIQHKPTARRLIPILLVPHATTYTQTGVLQNDLSRRSTCLCKANCCPERQE